MGKWEGEVEGLVGRGVVDEEVARTGLEAVGTAN